VIENRVLRRIFRPKRDEVIKGWRKLHIQELHSMNSSPNVIRVIKERMGMESSMHGAKRKAYRVLVGKPQGRKPRRRPRHAWEGNIKVDLKEIELDDMDWIDLAQDMDQWRLLSTRY
jgi:hypothetical protein